MKATFNEIEKIQSSRIENKSQAYLEACDKFEIEASKFATNENFVCRKYAEEVSLAYHRAKSADCEYMVYSECFAAEKWLERAWNNS